MFAKALLTIAAAVLATAAPAFGQSVPLPDDDPFYAVPAGIGELANGTVLASREVPVSALSVPLPVTAWQVKYKTIDVHDQPSAYVTTVMVPLLPWLGGGPRPLVSYQTAEDGVGSKCSPSYGLRAGLAAASSNSAAESIAMALTLTRGWAVAAPDYEGPRSEFLGASGEARGVLDGVRAALAFKPGGLPAGTPVGLWGYSGGALASSLAAQLQREHAPELKLAGVALGGTPADIGAVMRAFSGSLFGGALAIGLVGVDRSYPQENIEQYLNERGLQAMAASQDDCINDAVQKHLGAKIEDWTKDPGALQSPQVVELMKRISPLWYPGKPVAPVYEYHAVLDELAPIGPARKLVERYCRGGVDVLAHEDLASEHVSLIATGYLAAMGYLQDRFDGKPPPNNCKVPPDGEADTGNACAARKRAPHAYLRRSTLRASRRGVAFRGRAFAICDPTVSPERSRITRVTVAIARAARGRCQFLRRGGGLTARRSCRRPHRMRAKGASRWTFKRRMSLAPGRYRVYVQAADAGGRRERQPRRPSARFRVR